MARAVVGLHADHSRTYRENKFVYPVLSRRSRGISIGINLNPDRVCNFDCIYCQVDRRSESETKFVEMTQLLSELDAMLTFVTSGDIYRNEQFSTVPEELRRLNDIAFAGDGEPTTFRNFDDIVEQVAAVKRRHQQDDVKLVLITNASMFHRHHVEQGLAVLDQNNGEIWAKLETGTEEYYQLVERTKIPFSQVLKNILVAARKRPLVIQSLFMNVNGIPPADAEIVAYCERVHDLINDGGQIKLVQIYTVARPPAESFVSALRADELESIAAKLLARTGLDVEVFGG